MKTIHMLAKRREEMAALELARRNRLYQEIEQQLQSIIYYKKEYETSLFKDEQTTMTGDMMRLKQSFIKHLDALIKQNKEHLRQAEEDISEQKNIWQELYQKREVMAKLIEKLKLNESVIAERKQQRQLDELVQLLSFYNTQP